MNDDKPICKSEYVTMRDGIRLAVSIWLPLESRSKRVKYTAVVTTTRYWRAAELRQDNSEFQLYYPFACYLLAHSYVLVAVDARGSGASFGYRESEYSPAEVEDIGEVIEWVGRQAWCDGRVATEGTSYTAQTTLCSLITAPPALKAAVCRAPDFDMYRHVFAPGGIANDWFIKAWGAATFAQDSNDVDALFAGGYWIPPKKCGVDNVLGVRPVDEDRAGRLLTAAIAEHQSNFNMAGRSDKWTFVDSNPFDKHHFLFEPEYQQRIEKANVPVVIRCGWHDAGTALGALSMFTSFEGPLRVILGPWNHSGNFRVDPFIEGDDAKPEAITPDNVFGLTVQSLDTILMPNKSTGKGDNEHFRLVEYYTLGENRWQSAHQWPLPHTRFQRLYFAADQKLVKASPDLKDGSDRYQVDLSATTGVNNRWHAQTAGKPILFPDRQEADKKLYVYDSAPLENDSEITGHPVVHLFIRSSATDGQFFVYLEMIDLDGRVRMLTEGQLRGLHRKVSEDTPPYRMFGPYHSLKEKDALPLVPGEVAEIAFDLFPISVLLKKGQRIRVAIGGADASVFVPIEGCESPGIIIERNCIYASCIDLPIVSRSC